MARKGRPDENHQERLLCQALVELSQEEVWQLEEQLLQDEPLSQQADRLYVNHQAKVEAGIRRRLGKRRALAWRAVAVATSIALVILGGLYIMRPKQDLVVLSQPTGSLHSAMPSAADSPAPEPTAQVLSTPGPDTTLVPLPTATPGTKPASSPTLWVIPSPTPSPDATLEPLPTAPPGTQPGSSSIR